MDRFSQSRVTAVLGPTNTGKTYLAIERMLGHSSGMIGFPLRLLARENYERVVKIKGTGKVALVTGEEKITPPSARYFFCTVESMPLDRLVEFLAVDEVQLCADPERGHIFTDRLLHARGIEETMFLGADTIRPLLRKLVPRAEIISRPRFSTLSYAGEKKITRLPPRSAVVAFSAAEVYAMAELIRRQRGGTAVVLGALSPRTRNAQVGMFEAGEVDYLVATDAIGMGLNLNLDHVAFAALAKFDGQTQRRLTAAEIGQIAGRAGRHMSDGSFGTTNDIGALDPEVVDAVEDHKFEPQRFVFWRNRDLDFRSPGGLLKSLERRPPIPELIRAREAEDTRALASFAGDAKIAAMASHPAAVRLLWDVCQIPDFRKTLSDQHLQLLSRVFLLLMDHDGCLPGDWVAQQMKRLDRSDGDIDSLVARIAHIRTWTYISHRADWFTDSKHWQERARTIEDKLSDALHHCLMRRFVDRRSAILVSRLRGGDQLLAAVKATGDVVVEGEFVGRIEGFHFVPDTAVTGDDAKALLTAARRVLGGEMSTRLAQLEQDQDSAFALAEDGAIHWRGAVVARLAAGDRAVKPGIDVMASEYLDGRARERLRIRLMAWLQPELRRRLALLYRIADFDSKPDASPDGMLSSPAKGLLYHLAEKLGTLPRRAVAEQIAGLGKSDRKKLAALGIRLGAESVFLPSLLKPRPARLRALLWAVHRGTVMPGLPAMDRLIFHPDARPDAQDDESFCHAIGFRRLTGAKGDVIALRADALERLVREARRLSQKGRFTVTATLKRSIGCGDAEIEIALYGLGYQTSGAADAAGFSRIPPRGQRQATSRKKIKTPHKKPSGKKHAADSPFAKLRELITK